MEPVEPVGPVDFIYNYFDSRINRDEISHILQTYNGDVDSAVDYIKQILQEDMADSPKSVDQGSYAGAHEDDMGLLTQDPDQDPDQDVKSAWMLLNPVTSISSQISSFSALQSPSPSNVQDTFGMYKFFSEQSGLFDGIPDGLLADILKVGNDPEYQQEIEGLMHKFLNTTDEARDSIFIQIGKIQDPERQRALRYSYTAYSYAQALCCICHDKLAVILVNVLKNIFDRYQEFVSYLSTQPAGTGGISCASVVLNTLLTSFNDVFKRSFPQSKSATVGQPTCRAAGKRVIDVYCDWLRSNGIHLEPSVIAYMNDRHSANKLLDAIAKHRSGVAFPEGYSAGDVRFIEVVGGATHTMADATKSFSPDQKFGNVGLTGKDAAPVDNVGVRFLSFESLKTKGEKKVKENSAKKELFSFVDSVDSVDSRSGTLPELEVDFTVWDSEERKLDKSEGKVIPPLSYGVTTSCCVQFFDINSVDDHFVSIFDRDHNSDFFKPLSLMYMPTYFLNSMLAEYPGKGEEFKSQHKHEIKKFMNSRAAAASTAAGKSPVPYVPPTVHYEATFENMHMTLVCMSSGPVSNNVSSMIVDRAVPGVYNIALRGGISLACSRSRSNNVCYLGQTVDDSHLKKRDGTPSGLGEVITITGVHLKEDGDGSKADAVNKCKIVSGDKCKPLMSTVDLMAADSLFAYDFPVCTVGQVFTLKEPAGSIRVSHEAKREIAKLQAQIEKLNGSLQSDKRLHTVFGERVEGYTKKQATAISKTSMHLEQILSGSKDHKILPGILTAMAVVDNFYRKGWLVSKERFKEIVETPLCSRVHLGTQTSRDFVSLFIEPERHRSLLEDLGGLDLVIHPEKWVTTKRDCTTVSTLKLFDMVRHTLDSMPEIECHTPSDELVFEKCKQIFMKVHVFTLLSNYQDFTQVKFFSTKFGLGTKQTTISVTMNELRRRSLDPTILSLLKAHIELKTTAGSEWRTRSVNAVKLLFPAYDSAEQVEHYDPQSMFEESARESASQGGTSALVCEQEAPLVSLSVPRPFTGLGLHARGASSLSMNANPDHMDSTPDRNVSMFNLAQHKPLPVSDSAKGRASAKGKTPAKSAASAVTSAKGKAPAPAAAVTAISKVQKLTAPKPPQQKDRDALNRAQRLQNRSKGKGGGRGGGTRKKSKIQNRKITRKYKGKNSRHNHTIKNRHIRNYSLRNKQ